MLITKDMLDDKIDKLSSMMSRLLAQGSSQNRLLKPKIYQGKGYDNLGITIIKIDQTVVIGIV